MLDSSTGWYRLVAPGSSLSVPLVCRAFEQVREVFDEKERRMFYESLTHALPIAHDITEGRYVRSLPRPRPLPGAVKRRGPSMNTSIRIGLVGILCSSFGAVGLLRGHSGGKSWAKITSRTVPDSSTTVKFSTRSSSSHLTRAATGARAGRVTVRRTTSHSRRPR